MFLRVLHYHKHALRSYRYSSRELAELQARKLRSILTHAYQRVPLYHRWLHSRGLTPDDIRTVDDLRRLPTLSRGELRENSPSGIVDSTKDPRRAVVRRTSGTTGSPLRILQAREYRDLLAALRLRRCRMAGISPWDRGAEVEHRGTISMPRKGLRATNAGTTLLGLYRIAFDSTGVFRPGIRVTTFELRDGDLERVAHSLVELKPRYISSRPSYLRRLAYQIRKGGQSLHVPRLFTGGEYLSEGCRKELEELYQAELFAGYGTREMGGLAFECASHSGPHLFSDFFIFEVLRDGETVSSGEAGEVVITSLHNRLMPLIRYAQGDTVILEEGGPCSCGSHLPRLREIQGRTDDGVVSKEGLRIPPGPVIDHLESAFGLRDYQVIQRDLRHVRLRLPFAWDTAPVISHVQEYLRSLLGEDIDIAVETVRDGELPVKYRPIVSTAPPPTPRLIQVPTVPRPTTEAA